MTDPKFFISAPFGNYIKHKNAVSVTGTWTLNPRGNRLWSILKTLRYDFSEGCWYNALGLPNPGLGVGLEKTFPHEVLSIAETERDDFQKMSELIPENQSIELNLSCPNLGKTLPWDGASIFTKYKSKRDWCIAKVSPLTTASELDYLVDGIGFRQLHFSNTFPTKRGGLSGPILKPYTLELIRLVREEWGNEVEIVAGGGVDTFGGVYEYLNEGADYVALGSVCFNWFRMKKLLEK